MSRKKTKSYNLKIEFYKEHFLTALLNDLEPERTGKLDDPTFKSIDQILAQSIELAHDIREFNLIKKYFYENMEEFRELFTQWHKCSDDNKRTAFTTLKQKKIAMFKDFQKEWKKIESQYSRGDFKTLVDEFLRIQNDHMEALHESLVKLANDNPKFRLLKHMVGKFKKDAA